MKSLRIGLAGLVALSPVSAVASGANGTISMRTIVPVVCTLSVSGEGAYIDEDSVALGAVQELCNGANGYAITVSYSPGTLVGARLNLGGDTVTLDGSGTAVVSDVDGAGYRVRALSLDAGENGIDTLGISLDIQYRT